MAHYRTICLQAVHLSLLSWLHRRVKTSRRAVKIQTKTFFFPYLIIWGVLFLTPLTPFIYWITVGKNEQRKFWQSLRAAIIHTLGLGVKNIRGTYFSIQCECRVFTCWSICPASADRQQKQTKKKSLCQHKEFMVCSGLICVGSHRPTESRSNLSAKFFLQLWCLHQGVGFQNRNC